MRTLIKIFFGLLLVIFILPMLWLVLKELWWLFGVSLGGLFCGIFGDGFGWFLLTLLFIGIIIWILSNWD